MKANHNIGEFAGEKYGVVVNISSSKNESKSQLSARFGKKLTLRELQGDIIVKMISW